MAGEPETAPEGGPAGEAATGEAAGGERRDRFYTSVDGLTLHAAEYGGASSPWTPAVCIPGLSRNARDFHELAGRLARDPRRPRRVLAFDLRGRGLSDRDRNVARYTPLVEMQDVLDGMAAFGIGRAVVIGTSRGGIIAMLMAVARPNALAGLVLNDVGPELEPTGLARIKSYIGRTPAPEDWEDAAAILRRLHGAQFTGFDDGDWDAFARLTWRDDDGRPVGDYDPALAATLEGVEFDRPLPSLWNEFAALKTTPVLVIRGENSDLLAEATAERMAAVHPGLERFVVAGQGHAPLLRGEAALDRIAAFIANLEGATPPADATPPPRPQPASPGPTAEGATQ